ncbi:hypothetical protein F5141DRAFT_993862, partial [Pisolithus sp. B1]
KTCELAFKIIHSTTILLPTWHATCKETGKKVKQIPCNILTCWNSTFNMIDFILEYQEPVNAITDKLTKKTLNKYYLLTDMSNFYHIAMVLHPHHKLEYFRHTKWEADWIKTMSDLVHNTYKTSYAS